MARTIVLADIGLTGITLTRAGSGFAVIVNYELLDTLDDPVFGKTGTWYSSNATSTEGTPLTPTLPPAIEAAFGPLFAQMQAGLRTVEGL